MFLGRFAVALLTTVSILLGPSVARAAPPGGGGGTLTHDPIVFVHGYQGSGSNFNTMISRFKADGWTDSELWVFNYDSRQCIADSAAQLSAFIKDVLLRTGASRVDIIAHSLGGLVSSKANAPINQSAALGSPFKGTDTAYACSACACLEMRPPGPGGCLAATWWSPCDEVINPDDSAACGSRHQTACLSHMGLLSDSTVYLQVRDYVAPR